MKRFNSIQSHFTFYILLFLGLFSVTLILIGYISASVIRESFAIKYSRLYSRLKENQITGMITKNINASLQMSQSPAILNWMKNFNDNNAKKLAFETVENFKKFLSPGTDVFIAIHGNLHYYHNNKYINTLNLNKPDDSWYKDAISGGEKFILNIDYNDNLKTTKLWVNIPIKENGKIIGVLGTGDNISEFLQKVLETNERGTSVILTDKKGLIKAHKNANYVDKINVLKLNPDFSQQNILQKIYARATHSSHTPDAGYIHFDSSRYYISITYLESIKWYMLFLVKTNEIVQLSQFFPLILTSVLFILLFFILILFLSRRIIIKPLQILTGTMEKIAAGQLHIRLSENSNNELGKLTRAFNLMVNDMGAILSEVNQLAEKTTGSSIKLEGKIKDTTHLVNDITHSIQDIHKITEIQATAVEETSAAVNEMVYNIESILTNSINQANSIHVNSSSIEQLSASINSVSEIAGKANSIVNNLMKTADEGSDSVEKAVDAIKEIEASSQLILDIVNVITGIAEQTNLLAMNAAIEAAHAGSYGKGFAVVADEIRKLAENSGSSAKEITGLIKSIVAKIKNAVNLSNSAGKGLNHILSFVNETKEINSQIASTMLQQKNASVNVLKTMSELVTLSELNKNASEEQKKGLHEIISSVSELQDTAIKIKEETDEQYHFSKSVINAVTEINEEVKETTAYSIRLKENLKKFIIEEKN